MKLGNKKGLYRLVMVNAKIIFSIFLLQIYYSESHSNISESPKPVVGIVGQFKLEILPCSSLYLFSKSTVSLKHTSLRLMTKIKKHTLTSMAISPSFVCLYSPWFHGLGPLFVSLWCSVLNQTRETQKWLLLRAILLSCAGRGEQYSRCHKGVWGVLTAAEPGGRPALEWVLHFPRRVGPGCDTLGRADTLRTPGGCRWVCSHSQLGSSCDLGLGPCSPFLSPLAFPPVSLPLSP